MSDPRVTVGDDGQPRTRNQGGDHPGRKAVDGIRTEGNKTQHPGLEPSSDGRPVQQKDRPAPSPVRTPDRVLPGGFVRGGGRR